MYSCYFWKGCSLKGLVCKCDQEKSLGTMVDASTSQRSASAAFDETRPRKSSAVASQPNGRAAEADNYIEDQVRITKGALGSRTGARVPSTHPVTTWRVGCKNIVLHKSAAQSAGRTADHDSHGKPTSGRIINVDELVSCYICWRKKAKLGMGWAMRTWALFFMILFYIFRGRP